MSDTRSGENRVVNRVTRGILVHYHEIALKGRNRSFFLKQLAANLRAATRGLDVGPIRRLAGRLFLTMREETPWPEVRDRVACAFGVANFAPAFRVAPDVALLATSIQRELDGRAFGSFRVAARRAFKTFPHTSQEINQIIGASIREWSGAKVDLSNPDLTVHIEVLPDEAFFYFDKIQGPGGLPVGVSGTVVGLLSGGIDSPVAALRMMKRGCRVVLVHFHSQPFADRTSEEKAIVLARRLCCWQFASRLYLVPFGEVQQQVVAGVTGRFRVLVYRRLMLRIAQQIAQKEGAQALVTGESLGQVSSQTLENIAAIEEAAGLPILRPLIGMDKEEITREAQQIGTYDVSTIPDQDCCSMFTPREVVTRATDEEVRLAERTLDADRLVQGALAASRLVELSFPD
jgi:thiamine biosynthesis protein ThiI